MQNTKTKNIICNELHQNLLNIKICKTTSSNIINKLPNKLYNNMLNFWCNAPENIKIICFIQKIVEDKKNFLHMHLRAMKVINQNVVKNIQFF